MAPPGKELEWAMWCNYCTCTNSPSTKMGLLEVKVGLLSKFAGRNVLLVVDDAIVCGTTATEIFQMVKNAGTNKEYLTSAAPPICYP